MGARARVVTKWSRSRRAKRHTLSVATVRELEPAVVRAYSRAGDDLGVARLPWLNVAAGDLLELDTGGAVRVVDVVHAPADSVVGALVKGVLPSART